MLRETSIIKGYTYKLVDSEPFDIPTPVEFELYNENTLLAVYSVGEDDSVDYSFNTNTNKRIPTATTRPLDMQDIYFLLASRVIPNKTPLTELELERFDVFEYNPYDIVRKTHAMLRGDSYWIKFKDEELTYRTAREDWKSYFKEPEPPPEQPKPLAPIEDVGDILSQHLTNFADIADDVAHGKKTEGFNVHEYGQEEYRNYTEEDAFSPYSLAALGLTDMENGALPETGNDLTDEEIAKLFGGDSGNPKEEQKVLKADTAQAVAEDFAATDFEAPEPASDPNAKMGDDAIAALFASQSAAPEPAAPASDPNAKMGDDAIAAMFASQSAAPAAPASDPNAKMGDDAIAAMFASQSAAPEPAPASDPNAKMGDDAIAAMFASQSAAPEPEPAAPASDPNAKMGDDAIAAMFASQSASPEPAPASDPNAKMGDDAIAAMFASQSAAPEPAPASDPNAKMGDDAIAALFASQSAAPEPAPAAPASDPNAKMGDDAIAALFASQSAAPEPAPAAPASDPNAKMGDDAIAALFASQSAAPEPAPAAPASDPNAKMGDDAIAALFAANSGG
ncbi:hypothetical protein FACS1894120_0490 [Clostridia bacterium]|nr:hypothetical protein FACS1894120_0490 [Clostridia bacterium]